MRAAVRVTACVWVIMLGTAQPADAIWRWLEKMSGPGWYNGLFIEYKLECGYPVDLPINEIDAKAIIERTDSLRTLDAFLEHEQRTRKRETIIAALNKRIHFLESKKTFVAGGGISLPCRKKEHEPVGDMLRGRTWAAGVSGGMMWSTTNPLKFDESVAPEDTQVFVVTTGGFYDRRIPGLSDVEIGGSAEAWVFFGAETRTMFRTALEPRLTVTLWRFRDEVTGTPVLNLKARVGVLWVLPGFAPEDFGALPTGERLAGSERLLSVRFVADFECLPWKLNSCLPGRKPMR
jgi:hypothetical protein